MIYVMGIGYPVNPVKIINFLLLNFLASLSISSSSAFIRGSILFLQDPAC